MPKFELDIKNCKQCPFIDIQRCYTSDSWEHADDWFCEKADNKKISGYVGFFEEDAVEIPSWCPCKTKSRTFNHLSNWDLIQTEETRKDDYKGTLQIVDSVSNNVIEEKDFIVQIITTNDEINSYVLLEGELTDEELKDVVFNV